MATAPGSWGVEPPSGPADPPWASVLDEIAALGFAGVELGPVGYLPEDPLRLRHELDARGLRLAGGYLMAPFHLRDRRDDIRHEARRTCRVLAGAGARRLVLIEALVPGRSRTAGRPAAARRLEPGGWRTLLSAVDEVAALASDPFGLRATFHPHAGTVVEFRDEVERLLAGTDPDHVGLCLDTGHARYAGMEPAELYRSHAARVDHLHLKDLRLGVLARAREGGLGFESSVGAGVFCPLGEGGVDLPALVAALRDHGYEGWATFEQDRLPGDPRARADAAASLRYARSLDLDGEAARSCGTRSA